MMNTLVYIYVQKGFMIGQIVFKLFTNRLAEAMVNKTVVNILFKRYVIYLDSFRVELLLQRR
jgi:hypothetical protein